MARYCTSAACLALVAFSLTACSRNDPKPQAANPAPAAPQVESDHGDNDDVSQVDTTPRISLEPPREITTDRSGLNTPEESAAVEAPVEEEPSSPSIFRSLGRALTRGVSDAVTQGRAESPSDATLPPENTEPEATPQATEKPDPQEP
jgi:hypothetical protein